MMRCCRRCGKSLKESQVVWYREGNGKTALCRMCYSRTPEGQAAANRRLDLNVSRETLERRN
jgi:hypothetical protein